MDQLNRSSFSMNSSETKSRYGRGDSRPPRLYRPPLPLLALTGSSSSGDLCLVSNKKQKRTRDIDPQWDTHTHSLQTRKEHPAKNCYCQSTQNTTPTRAWKEKSENIISNKNKINKNEERKKCIVSWDKGENGKQGGGGVVRQVSARKEIYISSLAPKMATAGCIYGKTNEDCCARVSFEDGVVSSLEAWCCCWWCARRV